MRPTYVNCLGDFNQLKLELTSRSSNNESKCSYVYTKITSFVNKAQYLQIEFKGLRKSKLS